MVHENIQVVSAWKGSVQMIGPLHGNNQIVQITRRDDAGAARDAASELSTTVSLFVTHLALAVRVLLGSEALFHAFWFWVTLASHSVGGWFQVAFGIRLRIHVISMVILDYGITCVEEMSSEIKLSDTSQSFQFSKHSYLRCRSCSYHRDLLEFSARPSLHWVAIRRKDEGWRSWLQQEPDPEKLGGRFSFCFSRRLFCSKRICICEQLLLHRFLSPWIKPTKWYKTSF
jgi:hypothetical protein